jgi:hypothetical protein
MPRLKLRTILRTTVITVLLTTLAPGGVALAEGPKPILDPVGIRFQLSDEHARWSLTVAGPRRFHLRREFAHSQPVLSLAGAEEAAPADGAYVWELRRLDSKDARAAVWSGTFHVRDGRTLTASGDKETEPSADAPTPPKLAPTHSGNVSIDGRLCVGDQCDETVPIPFAAIKMVQNNTWILAEDDSNGATFATRDWQIKFNDSTMLGASYFGIEDRGDDGLTSNVIPLRVDAGAPTDSIRVDQNGNVGLGTATPGATLEVDGDAIVAGDFTAGSSREIKHAFEPVEPREVLAQLVELPISEWSYRGDRPEVRHLGPMAEDFSAAFALGRDDRHVSPVDLSGVAFAAIQGLHELLLERDAEIEELRHSRDELLARLEALERQVEERQAQP